MDFRRDLDRTARVLGALDADVIGLQEVLRTERCDQAALLASALRHHSRRPAFGGSVDMKLAWGPAREVRGGTFGNALLVRGRILETCVHDLAVPHCERRACLETLIECRDERVRFFVCHFGLGFRERERQAKRLAEILRAASRDAPRVVLGDFNEWQRSGPVSRAIRAAFPSAPEPRATHPSVYPIFALDRMAWDDALRGELRARDVKRASDHNLLHAMLEPC